MCVEGICYIPLWLLSISSTPISFASTSFTLLLFTNLVKHTKILNFFSVFHLCLKKNTISKKKIVSFVANECFYKGRKRNGNKRSGSERNGSIQNGNKPFSLAAQQFENCLLSLKICNTMKYFSVLLCELNVGKYFCKHGRVHLSNSQASKLVSCCFFVIYVESARKFYSRHNSHQIYSFFQNNF